MDEVTVRLLGDFTVQIGDREVVSNGWPRRDAATTVKLLALAPHRSLHRERLMDVLWPDTAPAEAAPRLHKAAHYARRALGRPDAVVLRGEMVSLFPGQQVIVDVEQFAVAAAEAVSGESAAEAAQVLDRFPGEPLPADVYESWAAPVCDRVLRDRAVLLRQAQRWDQLLELDPTDEQAHVGLMRSQLAAGDRSAVVRQFDRLDSALRRELGVGAGPDAVKLRDEALAGMRTSGTITAADEIRLDQQIRFCRTADDVTLAYATTGGGFPLVKTANWMTHLDHDWHSPVWRHWLVELSSGRRLVRYDERGCGLSDWDITPPTFDQWLHDLETVVDAAGLERFDLLGVSQGGSVALAYAAKYPDRVRKVVLYGAFDRGWLIDLRNETLITQYRIFTDAARIGWGRDDPWFRQLFTSRFMPGGSRELWEAFNDLQKTTTTPEIAAQVLDLCGRVDVTADAARVRAPTLILHGRHDQVIGYSLGLAMAAKVPDARFVALDTSNHLLLADEPAWQVFRREVQAFLDEE